MSFFNVCKWENISLQFSQILLFGNLRHHSILDFSTSEGHTWGRFHISFPGYIDTILNWLNWISIPYLSCSYICCNTKWLSVLTDESRTFFCTYFSTIFTLQSLCPLAAISFDSQESTFCSFAFCFHYFKMLRLPLQPLRYKVAISFDSREYYENFRPQGILCHEALPIQRTSDADLLSSDADQTPSSPEGKLFQFVLVCPLIANNSSAFHVTVDKSVLSTDDWTE